MISVLILVLASVAFLQFFVSYCRSVIAATSAVPLSEHVWDVTGIRDRQIRAEEFARLLQLANLCPNSGIDRGAIAAVRAYFRMLTFVRATLRNAIPGIMSWTEAELSGCAHFAAVALDRRILHSRQLMAQQYSSRY
jgi:hypothetical protein